MFLENNWDWSRKYPVIYISFGAGVTKEPSILEKRMLYIIDDHAKEYDVKLTLTYPNMEVRTSFMDHILNYITEVERKRYLKR